jgi:hypothetical protein
MKHIHRAQNSRLTPRLAAPRLLRRPGGRAAAASGRGPLPAKDKPDWVRILEEDAAVDEEIAELLKDTDGDPEKIRAKMELKLRSPFGSSGPAAATDASSSSGMGPAGLPFEACTGSDAPPHITFKEVDPFDLWVWLEFVVPPAQREKELLQSTLKSWFVVGKLGGFNSQNLQVRSGSSNCLWAEAGSTSATVVPRSGRLHARQPARPVRWRHVSPKVSQHRHPCG